MNCAGIKMDAVTATMIADGDMEVDDETEREAWQYLVDTGLAWSLQGRYGRVAKWKLEAGYLKPAKKREP